MDAKTGNEAMLANDRHPSDRTFTNIAGGSATAWRKLGKQAGHDWKHTLSVNRAYSYQVRKWPYNPKPGIVELSRVKEGREGGGGARAEGAVIQDY